MFSATLIVGKILNSWCTNAILLSAASLGFLILISELLINISPESIYKLIDRINVCLIQNKYDFQSNIKLKNYNLDINSKTVEYKNKKLKLTEKEIEIILFLNKDNLSKKVIDLQKNVWGYSSDIETHTVETHVYRLRKKISETFKDDNFILSDDNGYSL